MEMFVPLSLSSLIRHTTHAIVHVYGPFNARNSGVVQLLKLIRSIDRNSEIISNYVFFNFFHNLINPGG